MTAADFVRPGDAMLYRPAGFFGFVISLKTWHEVSHCEGFVGKDPITGKLISVASRDGIGVGQFDTRLSGLCCICRPRAPFDLPAAMRVFHSQYQGQGYDWFGLLRFGWRSEVSATRFNNKQFCSEFLTRWYRAGGLDPFNADDADAIAPFQFKDSDAFTIYPVDHDGTLSGV